MTGLMSTLTFDLMRLIRDSSIQQKLALYTTLQTLENEGHVLIYPNPGFWFRSAGGESVPTGAGSISVADTTLGTGKAAGLPLFRRVFLCLRMGPEASRTRMCSRRGLRKRARVPLRPVRSKTGRDQQLHP